MDKGRHKDNEDGNDNKDNNDGDSNDDRDNDSDNDSNDNGPQTTNIVLLLIFIVLWVVFVQYHMLGCLFGKLSSNLVSDQLHFCCHKNFGVCVCGLFCTVQYFL